MEGAPPTPKKTPPGLSKPTTTSATPLSLKEITRISMDLEKMTKQKPPSSPSLYANLLRDLYAGVVATEDLLRGTKIGINVNRLKSPEVCTDIKVREQANALVKKWKTDIQTGTKKAAGGRGSPASGGQNGGTSTPNGVKQESSTKSEDKWRIGKPEHRTTKTDEVNYQQTGDTIRDNCVRLMYDGLAYMSEDLPPKHILPVALSIEHTAHHQLSSPSSAYKEKMRSLYQNLKIKQNTHLRTALLATPPSLTPQHFVTMPAEAMKSAERLEEDAKMVKENKKDAMVPQEDRAISSMLTCGGCGQKKVSYSQAQTRSADEPMTTFCTCTVCGRKWKFS